MFRGDSFAIGAFRWGLVGAAVATGISQMVGGQAPVIYYLRPNTCLLRLGKTRWDGRLLLKGCTNAFFELLSNISMFLVNMLYNGQLIRYAGEK